MACCLKHMAGEKSTTQRGGRVAPDWSDNVFIVRVDEQLYKHIDSSSLDKYYQKKVPVHSDKIWSLEEKRNMSIWQTSREQTVRACFNACYLQGKIGLRKYKRKEKFDALKYV